MFLFFLCFFFSVSADCILYVSCDLVVSVSRDLFSCVSIDLVVSVPSVSYDVIFFGDRVCLSIL